VNADFGQQNAISNDILAQLLNDRNSNSATNQPNFVVIDCRFDYEHQGGQISGAINLNTKDAVQEYFFGDSQRIKQFMLDRTIIIFHCEFSQRRAPILYSYLRGVDRYYNTEIYPKLFYPEIYLLEGGYSKFISDFP
jgi:M-phase inducer tyrosine phosphatase